MIALDRRTRLGLGAALGVLVLLGALSWGLGRADRTEEAITALEAGDPQTALRALEEDDDVLPFSAVAYHDLALAHHAAGNLPVALAAWRAAADLAPRAPDIVHDLALAREKLPAAPATPVGPALPWLALVTPGEVAVLSLLLWLGAAVPLRRRDDEAEVPSDRLATGVLLVVLATATSGAALHGRHVVATNPVVVTLQDTPARDAPALDATTLHTLPLGSELRQQAARGAFLLVEDGDGRRGWIPEDAAVHP